MCLIAVAQDKTRQDKTVCSVCLRGGGGLFCLFAWDFDLLNDKWNETLLQQQSESISIKWKGINWGGGPNQCTAPAVSLATVVNWNTQSLFKLCKRQGKQKSCKRFSFSTFLSCVLLHQHWFTAAAAAVPLLRHYDIVEDVARFLFEHKFKRGRAFTVWQQLSSSTQYSSS